MFFGIGLIIAILGFLPLVNTLRQLEKYDSQQAAKKVFSGIFIGLSVILLLVITTIFLGIYTDYHWFAHVGFKARFWTVFKTQWFLFLLVSLFSSVCILFFCSLSSPGGGLKNCGGITGVVIFLGAIFLGGQAATLWEPFLLFFNQVISSVKEPIFNKSVSFYLFSLPFLHALQAWILVLLIVTIIISIGAYIKYLAPSLSDMNAGTISLKGTDKIARVLFILFGAIVLNSAFGLFLSLFSLLYSDQGAVFGAGYVEAVWVRFGIWISIGAAILISLWLFVLGIASSLRQKLGGIHIDPQGEVTFKKRAVIIPAIIVCIPLLYHGVIPQIVRSLIVNPNEITIQNPYLKHNIEFTRKGFGINDTHVTRKQYKVGRQIDQQTVEENKKILDNVRLWDWRALMDNLKEQQEIRLYYEFNDVDIDRYQLDGDVTQVMLAVRELEKSKLDPRSMTWVSKHLKYTHGYGMVFLPAHEILPQGKPNFLIRNIPADITHADLRLNHPEVYYGERTQDHVYVKTKEKEFDYPSGSKNVYTRYTGEGGIPMNHWLRRIAYAWKFDGHRQLFSTYISDTSRILFHRNIVERAKKIAPFLTFDKDPYAVLGKDGGIKYILDAYTVSSAYPYSERYAGQFRYFQGLNYIRNSVKVVVDAYDGSVDMYVVDNEDVIIRTYQKIFPHMFIPFEDMPEYLKNHIRYPADFLTIQAEMYATYHMNEPDVFYQREDVWQFATERYRDDFQGVAPYYVLTQFPERKALEFVLMLPYTPRNKNVMNAWIAGRCDPQHYGEIIVYTFPKGVEVLGPRQIEARIDQNTEMSQSMTLWGQRGSEVLRGNLLAIPLFKSDTLHLIYVEPVFLQAEDARLPELKRIVVADQNTVVWSEDFDTAWKKLIGDFSIGTRADVSRRASGQQSPPTVSSSSMSAERLEKALSLIKEYQRLTGNGDYSAAGRQLDELNSLLQAAPE